MQFETIIDSYVRTSAILTSNLPAEDRRKLFGHTAAVTALHDRLLHHAHVLSCGPRSWRTKLLAATESAVMRSR